MLHLPDELIKKILYHLNLHNIKNLCCTNKSLQCYYNDDKFWENYISNKHDETLLTEVFDLPPKNNIKQTILNLLNYVSDKTLGIRAVVDFLERVKIIKSMKRTEMGIPYKSKFSFITKELNILSVLVDDGDNRSWFYSDNFVLFLANNILRLVTVKDTHKTLSIHEDKYEEDMDISNVTIGDIIIDGEELYNIITGYDICCH